MNRELIERMKHSPVRNYAGVPGLTSWRIGGESPKGCVRLFECERDHYEHIVPHSHRYGFECRVLNCRGQQKMVRASPKETWYTAGETYSMSSDEVHSIYFTKGAVVLFFQGPDVADTSYILEPVANGVHVPTFRVEPWMFRQEV